MGAMGVVQTPVPENTYSSDVEPTARTSARPSVITRKALAARKQIIRNIRIRLDRKYMAKTRIDIIAYIVHERATIPHDHDRPTMLHLELTLVNELQHFTYRSTRCLALPLISELLQLQDPSSVQ